MPITEQKKAYNHAYNARKREEREAHAAHVLAVKQEAAAKARAKLAEKRSGGTPPVGWEVRVRPAGVTDFLVGGNVVYTTRK